MSEPLIQWLSLAHMPLATIYTRLGHRTGFSDTPSIQKEYGPLLQQLVARTRVRVFHLFQPFAVAGQVCSLGTHTFSSRLISERFARASKALVMAATADPSDVTKIVSLAEQGELNQSVMLDAVLSEKVDFALDFLETELAVQIRREGLTLGSRLSCGYSDFQLENQRYFFETLRLSKAGVTLNERFILQPEKTVTAVAPVFPAA